jgi:hypothetical protein
MCLKEIGLCAQKNAKHFGRISQLGWENLHDLLMNKVFI